MMARDDPEGMLVRQIVHFHGSNVIKGTTKKSSISNGLISYKVHWDSPNKEPTVRGKFKLIDCAR